MQRRDSPPAEELLMRPAVVGTGGEEGTIPRAVCSGVTPRVTAALQVVYGMKAGARAPQPPAGSRVQIRTLEEVRLGQALPREAVCVGCGRRA